MPEVAYRSSHPDVLAHWDRTATTEVRRAWKENQVDPVLAELGFPGRRFAHQGHQVVGVEYPRDQDPPEGWRRDRKLPEAIVPARRTSLGRKIAKRLDALVEPNPRKNLPGGMPDLAFSKGAPNFLRPGIARHGNAVFLTWSMELCDSDAAHIDAAVWKRIKLSEYYAVLEAQEEAKAS